MGRRVHPMGFRAESTLEFPMAPRITLVLALALLPAAVQAGSWSTGGKLQVRIAQNVQNLQASGHIRGLTNTMPLHIEILYNEYHFAAAFAVASLLALLALVTLFAKSIVEWKSKLQLEESGNLVRHSPGG